ncbi:hypothetical protein SAMN02800691_0106 [Luteibacter sp. UNCMF366Tsu5.1]|nr:hypothetical protein SAMN02800691_0106 [Luteibacter sp. UNCMF366Tsu5.1]
MVDPADTDALWIAMAERVLSLAVAHPAAWSWVVKFDGQREANRFTFVLRYDKDWNIVERRNMPSLMPGMLNAFEGLGLDDFHQATEDDVHRVAAGLREFAHAADHGIVVVLSRTCGVAPTFDIAVISPVGMSSPFSVSDADMLRLVDEAAGRVSACVPDPRAGA